MTAFILIVLGGAHAGFYGVDYYFRPWFRRMLGAAAGAEAAKSAA